MILIFMLFVMHFYRTVIIIIIREKYVCISSDNGENKISPWRLDKNKIGICIKTELWMK